MQRSLLDNKLVLPNNPRYIALTQSIANNFEELNNIPRAIEFSEKSYMTASQLYGKESTRAIKSYIKFVELIYKSDTNAYNVHLKNLRKIIKESNIQDKVLMKKIANFK